MASETTFAPLAIVWTMQRYHNSAATVDLFDPSGRHVGHATIRREQSMSPATFAKLLDHIEQAGRP